MSPEPQQSPPSDTELIHAIARGDEKALASLYDRYGSILLGLLLRILHSRAEAEDVLQEVFIQIWRQASDFDIARGRAFTWLVTLARSRAIDRLRSVEARNRAVEEAARETPNNVGNTDDSVSRSEQSELVRRALAEIPEEQRRALFLGYFEGLTQSEIAARLGEPLGTVKTRMRAGLIKMRELLRKTLER